MFPVPNVPVISLRIKFVLAVTSGAVAYLNPASVPAIYDIAPMSLVRATNSTLVPFTDETVKDGSAV